MNDTVLNRADVVRSLERAAARRVTVVAAPTGFGKSTMLRALRAPTSTLLKIRTDDTFERFVYEVVREVAPFAPGMNRSMPAVYAQTLERADGPEALAAWFCHFLDGVEHTFVLDGADVAADPQIAAFLRAAIAVSGDTLHWIVAGRDAARLRDLAGEAGADEEIGEDRLILTFPELRRLAMRLAPGHTSGELLAVARKAAGSISRAVFVLRCLHFGVSGAGDSSTSFESLLDFCFSSLSERERLETMAGMLLERGASVQRGKLANDVSSVVSRLRTTAPHLFEVGGERLQACFRARIEREIDALLERNRSDLYVRAADALEANGDTASAIALYCAVDAVDRLLDVVERGRGFGIEGEPVHALREALEMIPSHIREGHALVVGLRAVDAANRGRHAEAMDLFERALGLCRPGDHEQSIRYWYSLVASKLGDNELAQRLLKPGVAFFRTPPALRASMMSMLGVSHAACGNATRASRWIGRARIVSDALGDDALAARIYQQGAYVALRCGDFDQAYALGLRAVEYAKSCGWPHVAGIAYSILFNVAVEQDRHTEIGTYARCVAENAARSGNRPMEYYALTASYEYEVERCNLPALAEIATKLERFDAASVLGVGATVRLEAPSHAVQLAWEGRFVEAYRTMEPLLDHFERDDASRMWEPLTFANAAVYAAAAGLVAEGNRALRLYRTLALREARPWALQRARIAEAIALWLLAKERESRMLLRSVLTNLPGERVRLRVFAEFVLSAMGTAETALGPALTPLEEEMYGNGWGGLVRLMRSLLAGTRAERRSATGLNRALG